ncbi:hypothetical protein QMK33_18295 [Hymenobacter sp. H14-R3]|uniref:hypothetical protein n=1 Tax=Hymenobacter sp. H14-R3 TaxID=3046308 RepID=UPI0024B8EC10|nr:hypothetical protein [Hymenobacter sp. H14-R3]MDJ0367105.1 hypothetical protein [Hymenobacter sp. H14-R3]
MRISGNSRRIVVDTNVAKSASASVHPTSDACRAVLETMLAQQHQVVLSPMQYQEWLKHQSGFAKTWLASMLRKKLYVVLRPEPDSGITARVHQLACTGKARYEMLKDVHLLENALATDHAVVSQETNVLALFTTHAQPLQIPRPVAWINPVADKNACVAWLEAGVVVKKVRCIPAGV